MRHGSKGLWILAGVLLVVVVGMGGVFAYGTADTVTATVSKTERITTGSGDSLRHKYLVFTDDETFENTDTVWYLKFNSSDVQGRIKDGERYSFKVYGWRVPFLSWYRNIIKTQASRE